MSKHTPEPWFFESEPAYCSEIFGSNGESVCAFVDDPSGVDVERILSCVNACAGMSDPAAEIAELKRQRDQWMAVAHEFDIDRQKLADERDELLAALEAVQAVANNSQGIAGWHLNGDLAGWDELLPEVGMAIANVTGGGACTTTPTTP